LATKKKRGKQIKKEAVKEVRGKPGGAPEPTTGEVNEVLTLSLHALSLSFSSQRQTAAPLHAQGPGLYVFVRFSLGGGSEFRLAMTDRATIAGHGGCQIGTVE